MKVWIFIGLISIVSASHGQMTLSGTATGSCDCYTLTTAVATQAGSIWSPSTISLANPFDIKSRIFLGYSDGGADGMTFVLRQSGTGTGIGGGDLGYGGILNSIAVEIDTWNNGGVSGDLAADHIGMNSNGVLTHNLVAPVAIPNIENGVFHDFRVTWNPGTLQLQVFLDGVSIFIYTGDLVATVFGGSPNVFFGWTAATGGATNLQQVCIDLEADFTADDFAVCPGQEISFSNTSVGGLNINSIDMVSYAWTFGGGVTSALENPTHTYLTEGPKIVTLTVTNMIGCTDTKTLYVMVDSIEIDMESTDIACFGDDDGDATAVPVTGDAPYDFLWDDPLAQVTETATALAPGVYTVTVTDAVGCVQYGSVEVSEPDELLLLDALLTNATCGLVDGEISLSAEGGTPAYEFSINAGLSFEPTGEFLDLSDGPYSIVIRDDNGCLFEEDIEVLSDPLDLTMTKTDITCFEFEDGTATALPAFGVGPCTFLWDDPLAQTTATAIGLAPGTYTAFVEHIAIGCSGSASIIITQPSELLINSVSSTNASCGIDNGIIALEVIGGTPPYSYSIDGGVTSFPSPSFTGLAPGDYSLEVTDANGCVVTGFATLINVSNVPVVLIAADPNEGCKALEVNLTNLSDPALTAFTDWNLGDGSIGSGSVVNHVYETAGCYDVHVDITTFDGCSTSADFYDYICVWELPIASFSFTPEDPDMLDNTVKFMNQSEFASNYEWTFGDGNSSFLVEPEHAYPEIGTVNYPVQLIAITDKGCRDTTSRIVTVKEVVLYYIPNAFTPDGDEFNAVFKPQFLQGFSPADYHLVIYNRYGEMVWESYNTATGWNGTYGGDLVNDGVYIWQLTFRENSSDKRYAEYGHVTILK